MPKEDANLNLIPALRKRYGCPVGYSGHEASLNVKDLLRLTEDVRLIETILGDGEKKLSEKEMETRKKLRGC